MNRRHVLGLAAAAAVTTGCTEKAAAVKPADVPLTVRKRMRALALTLLLTSKKLRAEFVAQNPASPTYGGGVANHPFDAFKNNITDQGVFHDMLVWVLANPGTANTNLDQIGSSMRPLAQAAGVTDYTPPECPCQSSEYADCPPVDPLLV